MEDITKELAPKIVIKLPTYLGINWSITNYAFWLFVSMIVAFFVIWLGARKPQLIPRGWQSVIEALVEFIRNSIVIDIIGPEGAGWFPFIATLFIFIWVANLVGLIPGAKTATAVTGTTGAWAVLVFLAYNYIGIRKKGPIKYFLGFVPKGVPLWLAPFMFILEFVSHLLRPFSLAVRLFANMTAGHLVLGVFTLFAMQAAALAIAPLRAVAVLPIAIIVILLMFELFVATIQAYIFSILAAIYIGGALAEEH